MNISVRFGSFTLFLTIMLAILKCTKYISCSWWFVFTPLFIMPSIYLITILIAVVLVYVGGLLNFLIILSITDKK